MGPIWKAEGTVLGTVKARATTAHPVGRWAMTTVKRKMGVVPVASSGPGNPGRFQFAVTLDQVPTREWMMTFAAAPLTFKPGPRAAEFTFSTTGNKVMFETVEGQVENWIRTLDILIEHTNKELDKETTTKADDASKLALEMNRLAEKFKDL
jgi:hypothetical protein